MNFFSVLRVVFFHLIVYVVSRYMYDAVRRDFALSASFVWSVLMSARLRQEKEMS